MAKNKENKQQEKLLKLLVEALAPKKEKKLHKDDIKNRIIVIDGIIHEEMLSLNEAKKYAKNFATHDVEFEVYALEGKLSVNLPVELETK